MFADHPGDGQTLRAATVTAAMACAVATAFGAAAERYAERYVDTGGPRISELGLPRPSGNAFDYATTGSIGGGSRRELFVIGPCGDRAEGP
jgi:hypothetical protein